MQEKTWNPTEKILLTFAFYLLIFFQCLDGICWWSPKSPVGCIFRNVILAYVISYHSKCQSLEEENVMLLSCLFFSFVFNPVQQGQMCVSSTSLSYFQVMPPTKKISLSLSFTLIAFP